MKKKVTLSTVFIASLLPMLLNQYGGSKGVQEITGLINLLNPIGILSVVSFLVGVWVPFKRQIVGKILGALGTIGIAVSEVYQFFTWHVMTITGEVSLRHSINLAFPEFYFGLAVSIVMIIAYVAVEKEADNALSANPLN